MTQAVNILGDASTGGPSRVLPLAQRSWEAIVTGQTKSLVDSEINLAWWLEGERRVQLARAAAPSGWLQMGQVLGQDEYTPYTSVYNHNAFYLAPSTVLVNGLLVHLSGSDTIAGIANCLKVQLAAPPSSGARYDFVFLEVWLQEVGPPGSTNETAGERLTTIYQDGHQIGTVDTTPLTVGTGVNQENLTTLTNDLEDPTLAVETTGRLQVCWRIRAVSNVNAPSCPEGFTLGPQFGNTPNAAILAQGGMGAPVAGKTFVWADNTTPANWAAQVGTVDNGLYVAGAGTQADGAALDSADGRVYGLPLCHVHRRNTTTYADTSNRNGAQLADSTYGLNGTITAGLATSASYRFSDRPDGLFADIINAQDVYDLRHQVSLSGLNYAALRARAMTQLLAGQLHTRSIATQAGDTPYALPLIAYNDLAHIQISTGAAAAIGSAVTDGVSMSVAMTTGGALVGGPSLPVRRRWSDETTNQAVALPATLTNAGIGSVVLTLTGAPTGSGTGSPLVVFDSTAGHYALYRADTGAPITISSSSGLGTVAATLNFTNPGVTGVVVVASLAYSGYVGALYTVPTPLSRTLANATGAGAAAQWLAACRNLNGADPQPFWAPGLVGAAACPLNPPVGQRYGSAGGVPDQMSVHLDSAHYGYNAPSSAGPALLTLTVIFTGTSATTVTIGSGGVGSGSGTATLYGRTVRRVIGGAVVSGSANSVSSITQTAGVITVTWASTLGGGSTYSLTVVLDGTVVAVQPATRGVVDVLRAATLSATLDGVSTSYTLVAPGLIASAPAASSALLGVSTAPVGGGATATQVAAATVTVAGPTITVTFGSAPAAGTLTVVVWYAYQPTTTDQLVASYVWTPYQGCTLDIYVSNTAPALEGVYNLTVLDVAPDVLLLTRGTGDTAVATAGLDPRPAGSTIGLPLGHTLWDGAYVGDAPDGTSANGVATRAAVRNLALDLATAPLTPTGVQLAAQFNGINAAATRGQNSVRTMGFVPVKEQLEGALTPTTTALAVRSALVSYYNRLYLLVVTRALTGSTSTLQYDGDGAACDLYELPGRPLVLPQES